ncbi:hypothetical protein C1646_755109 [Rhizophagus diaphanus]|nr:hypothetical protein C1646_755109 [Rhizophagus diaphanus] [Rhizophagus sp. MUCL 43196]
MRFFINCEIGHRKLSVQAIIKEENFDEISEPERISLEFNELLENINDDTDNTSTFSDIDFEEREYLEEKIKKQKICDEIDKIIEHLEQQNFTLCYKGTGKLKQLHNLFGTWQVDRDAIKEVNSILSKLGVCDSHFQFDNKYLHQSISKKTKNFNEVIIQ